MRPVGMILVGVLLAACKNGNRRASQEVSPDVPWVRVAELYFSTEVNGFIEPCGCTTEPLGGVQRLATVIEQAPKSRALIDAGNLLFPAKPMAAHERDQHILKARVLARVYRQLGAVALNVAAADLANGAAFLKELQRDGAVPLVSANVRPIEGGPSVARSFLRTVGGIKVGVTGVATPETLASHQDTVTVIEYAPAVSSEVKILRKRGAEVVVVLAHTGDAGARELARSVPDIDVVLRAPGTPIERDPASPIQVGSVVVAEAGRQGQHVGRLTIRLGKKAPARPIPFFDGGQEQLKRRPVLGSQDQSVSNGRGRLESRSQKVGGCEDKTPPDRRTEAKVGSENDRVFAAKGATFSDRTGSTHLRYHPKSGHDEGPKRILSATSNFQHGEGRFDEVRAPKRRTSVRGNEGLRGVPRGGLRVLGKGPSMLWLG